jgi:hypothetical protein
MRKTAILVTGSHRSGSTWVGEMISHSPSVNYLHEPFNIYYDYEFKTYHLEIEHWFQYISQENESLYYKQIVDLFDWKAHLRFLIEQNIKKVKSKKDLIKISKSFRVIISGLLFQNRILLKDPLALFSAEWLAENFDLDVLVLIRHPAAFAGSIKIKKWNFPFKHFLEQPLLMRDYLYPFEAEIKAYAKEERDIIDQAALLWQIIHQMILGYQKRQKDWLFLRHEDISRNPLEEFKKIFNYLDLEFSPDIQNKIDYGSTVEKPIRFQEKNRPNIQRNSRSVIWEWAKRLEPSEIDRIRSKVEHISCHFYGDADWEIPSSAER